MSTKKPVSKNKRTKAAMPSKKPTRKPTAKQKAKKSFLFSRLNQKQLTAVVFVVLFGAIGSYMLYQSFAAPSSNSVAVERFVNKPDKGLIWDGLEEPVEGSPCFVPGQGKGKGLLEMKDKKTGKHLGCTHGPDPAPEGVNITARIDEQDVPAATTQSTALATCDGDGVTGNRVQAIYAHAADTPDRFDSVATTIQEAAARVNRMVDDSAAETGGSRHVKWVTDSSCNLLVERVQLSSTGDDNFSNTRAEMQAIGLNRTDRKYMIWVDAGVYCGIATIESDDQPGQSNLNNRGPSYARVDSGCWGLENAVEGHELMHNLGGVQWTAPHRSMYWHCTDDWDRMCYPDEASVTMTYTCPHDRLFDCNHDDYFYAGTPPAGNYLASYWNTANNSFLIGGGPPAPAVQCSNSLDDDADGKSDYPADPGCTSAADTSESPDPVVSDTVSPVVSVTSPKNNAMIRNSVSIAASATDNVKVTRMEVYIDGALKSTTATGSISYTWNAKKASRGNHTITVKAYDAVGNMGQSSVSVTK